MPQDIGPTCVVKDVCFKADGQRDAELAGKSLSGRYLAEPRCRFRGRYHESSRIGRVIPVRTFLPQGNIDAGGGRRDFEY